MDAKKRALIKGSIEIMVLAEGNPVIGQALIQSGMATRTELRKLEKSGDLKVCLVDSGRGIMKAYYTEGAVPHALRDGESNDSEQPSEVHNPESSEVST